MSKKQKSVKEQIFEFLDNDFLPLTPYRKDELAESLTRLFRRMLRKRKNG